MKKFLTVLSVIFLINSPNVSAETLDDAGRQLDRLRQDMEKQRIKEQIDEDRNREENSVEVEENKTPKGEESNLKFLLTKITVDESEIITEKILNELPKKF